MDAVEATARVATYDYYRCVPVASISHGLAPWADSVGKLLPTMQFHPLPTNQLFAPQSVLQLLKDVAQVLLLDSRR